jgi:hypothetical protein
MNVPNDPSLVDRVRKLVAEELDDDDEVAGAQEQLPVELAAGGWVSACRELRLFLLEMRVASDPAFEAEVTQALALERLIASIGVGAFSGVEPAAMDVPPGWRSTEKDGEILEYLPRRWFELRAAEDFDGVRDIERWLIVHHEEVSTLRRMGRWPVWPEDPASL